MESLDLSQKDAQSKNKWRKRINILRGQPANPGSPGKMAIKTECVCVFDMPMYKRDFSGGWEQFARTRCNNYQTTLFTEVNINAGCSNDWKCLPNTQLY